MTTSDGRQVRIELTGSGERSRRIEVEHAAQPAARQNRGGMSGFNEQYGRTGHRALFAKQAAVAVGLRPPVGLGCGGQSAGPLPVMQPARQWTACAAVSGLSSLNQYRIAGARRPDRKARRASLLGISER